MGQDRRIPGDSGLERRYLLHDHANLLEEGQVSQRGL
jgi:hypothetical protein